MKILQFAIASIVDANTGHGLDSKPASEQIRDYRQTMQKGIEIRAKPLIAIFASIKKVLAASLTNYRVRVKQRADLEALLSLDEHMLRDIGINRGDLPLLKSGVMTLQQLATKRQVHRQAEFEVYYEGTRMDDKLLNLSAANQQRFSRDCCA